MKHLLSLTLAAGLAMASAQATVISGEVTGGSASTRDGGIFIKLTVPFADSTPDNTIGNNTFDNSNVYAFDEEQNVMSDEIIRTDVGMDVPVGEIVASHYIAFDPVAAGRTVEASITFDAPIFGAATSTAFLAASDFLANTGVTYLNPTARGLEGNDRVMLDPNDPNTLLLSFFASTPGDYIRVFTQFSPAAEVPVPAGVWLFGSAAALLGARMKRRQR